MQSENKRVLQREDIVGNEILNVFRSEWECDPDGYCGAACYIEMKNEFLFELVGIDIGTIEPIRELNRADIVLIDTDDWIRKPCIGQTIVEVVASEYWAFIGLLLSNQWILYIDQCGIKSVGPCVGDTRGTDAWRVEDYMPYWSEAWRSLD